MELVMISSIFLSIGWLFLLQYFKGCKTTYMKHFFGISLGHGLLKLYSSLIFPEPAVESIGPQAYFFLKPYCRNSSGFPLLVQLTELVPVNRDPC